MSFLGVLANQINSQLGFGENNAGSLDSVANGQNQKYGALGDFANQIDQSSERRYVEEGYLRKNPFQVNPKQFEILMQEPSATVLIKKRMFSSIADNYRSDFMDSDEKLYYKAIRVLFQNKCAQIAVLEKLAKFQKIVSGIGNLSDQLVPIVIGLGDQLTQTFSNPSPSLGAPTAPKFAGSFISAVDRLRRLQAFNTANTYTTWITDSTNLFQSQFGEGTGVIEITNFTGLNTTTTTTIKNPGSFSLTISDPYETMVITEYDIEKAISDATNSFYNHKSFQFGQETAEQVISDRQTTLNQLRASRGVSPISFSVNPDALFGNRVTAIITTEGIEIPFDYNSGFGGVGSGVTVSNDYLQGGAVAGVNGLSKKNGVAGEDLNINSTENEYDTFKNLIIALFNKMQLDASSRVSFQNANKKYNYARKKLRFNFLGKLIIQPMDSCHILVNTKSRYDNKLLSGLNNMFSGAGILQNLNNATINLKNSADFFNPSGSVNLQIEKAAFVGPDFPNFLWSQMRSQFVNEKEGTHIFAGLVEAAHDVWTNDGKFTVSVSGKDNSAYFDMGMVNFKPAVDSFNGAAFDPLTPFVTNFDTISSTAKDKSPELLDENKILLGDSGFISTKSTSPLVKFKLGPHVGLPATSDNILYDNLIDQTTATITKVIHAPDGLVYKWKEGIGVLTQFGSSTALNDFNKVGTPTIYKDPFAGQDVMNVISLLITGQPYNYATYWKVTQNVDAFGKDAQTGQHAADPFYQSLQNGLIKNNTLWGNFLPFKSLSMDEATYVTALQNQTRAIKVNQELDNKLQQLSNLVTQQQMFAVSNLTLDQQMFSSTTAALQSQITTLKDIINSKVIKAQQTKLDDVSFDSNDFTDNSKNATAASDASTRRLLRRQINFLTRRLSYNIRGNEDKNFFIVDDSYDKDYDITAYNQALESLKLYENSFTTVRDKIIVTADLLNLEVFCDSQGHIRVRAPQYNRMPSSVFYNMMYTKKAFGIQVFPQFIDDLFSDQLKTLQNRLEILENLIRLDCAAVGINDDTSAESFIFANSAGSGSGSSFQFVTADPTVSPPSKNTDLNAIVQIANADSVNNSQLQNLNSFVDKLKDASSTKAPLNTIQRSALVIRTLTSKKLNQAGYGIQDISNFNANTRIDQLVNIIKNTSGQQLSRTYFLTDNAVSIGSVTVSTSASQTIDIFKVTKDLSDQLRERQKVLKLFYSALKNCVEFKSLDNDRSTANQLLTPANYNNSNTPEVFEHMIEDETYDDYGPGSGARYIIKRSQIKNIQIGENPPDFTMIEVRGVLNTFAPTSLPPGLNSFPDGGNGLVTAIATDYDMWRNYGFRHGAPINVPFLSDPNTQVGPYASMILSRNRKNILRGNVTISGNEFMQPGEVVYIEDRGLLFYVNSVKHNFAEGSSFTTQLELSYGHAPGEYIPTILDVIGKMIYKNKDSSSFVVQRQSNASNEANIGVFLLDKKSPQSSTNTGDANQPINPLSEANTNTLNNILYMAANKINNNNQSGNNVQASVELRIYYNNATPFNSDLNDFATTVLTSLTQDTTGPKTPIKKTGSSTNSFRLTAGKNVSVVTVNLDKLSDARSPSQKALDASRNYTSSYSTSGQSTQDQIRKNLFGYIVDCWITLENTSTGTS